MFRVNSAGCIRIPDDWSLTPQRTRVWRDFDLWFLLEGRGEMEHAGGVIRLLPGACLILRGGQDYTFRHTRPFRHFWAHFDVLDAQGSPLPLAQAPVPELYRLVEEPAFLQQLLERLVESQQTETPAKSSLWLTAAIEEITALDRQTGKHREEDLNAAWLDELCGKIREHPERDWPVSQMAQELGVCRSYLYKLFRRRTGRSPQQLVMEERMRLARFLLQESSSRIGAIAVQLGYRDVYFFCHQFKSYHGQSPTAFRQSPP